MNRIQRRAKGNGKAGETETINAIIWIYKDAMGNLRCNWAEGMKRKEVRQALGMFKDIVNDQIVEEIKSGTDEKPEPSKIVKPF